MFVSSSPTPAQAMVYWRNRNPAIMRADPTPIPVKRFWVHLCRLSRRELLICSEVSFSATRQQDAYYQLL